MTNPYLEKIAKIVEKQPGVWHEVGTSDFFVDRPKAEEWIAPKDAQTKANARMIFGGSGAIAGGLMTLNKSHFKKAPAAIAVGGLIGAGVGHLIANAGLRQDRDYRLLENAKKKINGRYSWELNYARRNGGNGNSNVTIFE